MEGKKKFKITFSNGRVGNQFGAYLAQTNYYFTSGGVNFGVEKVPNCKAVDVVIDREDALRVLLQLADFASENL